jgi:hypothetical protein
MNNGARTHDSARHADAQARILEQRGPRRLPDQWPMTKTKGDHTMTAVCEVWAVELGWDLRLMIDGHGLQMSSLCRSAGRWSIALTSGVPR